MPLYNSNGGNMAQMAQAAMGSATQAAAGQQRQTKTVTKRERSFWDDFKEGAQGIGALASAANGVVSATRGAVDLYDDFKIKDAYDAISKAYADGGMAAIDMNPDFQDYYHAQALGRMMKDRAATSKGQLEMQQNAEKLAEKNYADTRAVLIPALEAYKNGDMAAFSRGMVDASNIVSMPYRLEATGDGNFRLFFRSTEKGGWTDAGRTLSAQEAHDIGQDFLKGEVGVLSGMGMSITPYNRNQILQLKKNVLTTHMLNTEVQGDPARHKAMYDAQGRFMGMAIPLNSIKKYEEPTVFEAYGSDGKRLGTLSLADIYGRGLHFGSVPGASDKSGRHGRGGYGGMGVSGSGGGNGYAQGAAPGVYPISEKQMETLHKSFTISDPATGENRPDTMLIEPMMKMMKRGVPLTTLQENYYEFLNRFGAEKGRENFISALKEDLGRNAQEQKAGTGEPAAANNRGNAKENPLHEKIRGLAGKKPTVEDTYAFTPEEVWGDLTEEEKTTFQKTRRLPERFTKTEYLEPSFKLLYDYKRPPQPLQGINWKLMDEEMQSSRFSKK